LEHEIYQSGGNYVVPFVTSFGSAGNYRFELYRLDLGDSQTWIPVANSTQTVAAGITHKTISVSTSSISPGDVLSMIAIGESGANINNTSEFAFPLQNEPYIFPTLAPRVWDVALRSSTWSSGDTYDYAPLVNLNVGGTLINAQTAPMPYTGPNATDGIDLIDVLFSKPVNIATSNLRVRTSNSLNPFITPTGIVPNPDGNPFTHDYRLTFANDLPSDKYLLEIDSAVNDLGGKRLDGEWNVDHGVPDDYFDDSLPPNGNFTSGNGIDSGDFKFRFAILYGDADLNGMVNSDDKVIGLDVNRDGVANAADTAIIDDIIANGVTRLPVLQIRGADFNDDEITDSQDLAIWQASYGIDDDADADGDYDSDGRDFLIWQSAVGGKSAWYTGPPGLSALTVGVAPQVMNVIVSSSMAYEPSHPAYSFDTVDGSGSQLATVPVALADTISIVFSENINISAETLIVVGLTTANVPELAEFVYDPLTFTATWRFEGWALGDNYLLYLSDSISDIDGNFLDGEWTNPASIMTTNSAVSEFPSGDGDSGGAFIFTMTLLPGDANLNGVVDGNDYSIWTSNYAADGSFWEGDFDGDGIVGTADIAILYQTYGFNLQNTFILSDLDQDGDVDDDDIEVIGYNLGMTSADWEDGDLNGDSIVDELDLDLAFAQFGIELTNVVA
jgi:hypothetical protein